MSEERMLRLLPIGLLLLSAGVATGASPAMGDAAADVRAQLAVAAVTLAWVVLAPRGRVHWVVRAALAFVLCLLNPFYAIFAWFGFIDVWEVFPGRAQWVGLVVVAVTQAGAQAGGLPPDSSGEVAAFVALLVVNVVLAGTFAKIGERSENRATELERLNAELEQALADNDALHEQLVEQAREAGVREERQRLAREIHDTLAQNLAGIVTQLEAGVGGERQERALGLAREALGEARRSVLDLSPGSLDGATLPAALDAVLRGWSTDREVRADLVLVGDPEPLHPEVEATVLRVAQESLANVAKHAGAGRVGVTLSYDGDEVVLDVRDDGAGFDPGATTRPSSFGLRGMRQRAQRLAGVLAVESGPGRGTAVSLRLPALAREAA